jgi:pimeloyl-ACP methyl ester carboxylesterase
MTSAMVEIGSARMRYSEDGLGPPVLLVHGTAANQWGRLPALLGRHCRVISYDRRGFGSSTGEAPASLSTHAGDAAALLDSLEAAPAVIVGWSIGGVIALELASARPDLVAALVLIEPPLYAKRHPTARLLAAIFRVQLLRRLRDDGAAAAAFLNWAGRLRGGGSSLDRMTAGEREQLNSNAGAIVGEIDLGTGEHLDRELLARIACPAVCLVAELSDHAFQKATERVAEILPSADLQAPVAGAGHWLQLEDPDRVARAVEGALRLAFAGQGSPPAGAC